MWDRMTAWLDNPILVKHARSRLRPQHLFTSLAVVVILCLVVAYAGWILEWYRNGTAAGCIVALQIVILTVIGAGQVNASVNGARASGILDFHRVSPVTATELTLGFFFGAPIREYLLFAATLPFMFVCMAFGVPSIRSFVQLTIIVLTTSWTVHGLMLLSGLVSKSKTPSGGMIGLVVFLFFFFYSIVMGAQASVNWTENDHRLDVFGISLPWLAVILLYEVPVLFLFLLAATRKMESQRLHPLSRPQAIAAMVTFAALILGGIWRKEGFEIYRIAALYLLAIPALLLLLMITPNQAEFAKGLYRARKRGRTRLPWWDDFSFNWITVAIIAGIILAAGTIAATVAAGAPDPAFAGRPHGPYPLALAATVLVVAYFGLALQYFQLRFGRRAMMFFALFLFVFWLLPLLAGAIQAMASGPTSNEQAAFPLLALSPVAGIGMTAGSVDEAYATAVHGCTITPALFFTFVFNYLLVGARRRIMKTVFLATAASNEDRVELAFVEPVAQAAGG